MNARVVRPSEVSAERFDAAIVIDVLRATTTAAVLCHRLGEICVVRTPSDLDHVPVRSGGYALFSELSGVESSIPRFDNSPVQARDADLGGRTPVLVTTNGTLAIGLAAGIANEVVLAGFINFAAVVEHLRAGWGGASVAVIPAGHVKRAERHAEDDACAEALVEQLADRPVDVAAVIARSREDARILERRAREPNLDADLKLCFGLDAVPVVPRVAGAADQAWFSVTAATVSPYR